MTVLAVAALSLAQAAGQEPSQGRLTLSTGLLPASQTLAELSRATGLELRTVPATAYLPLMVRVTNADSQAVLGHVAQLLGAEWKQEGSAYVLSSDTSLRRKLSRAKDNRRVERLSKKLGELAALTRDVRYDEAFALKSRDESKKMMEGMMKSITDGGEPPNPMAMFATSAIAQSPGSRAINSLLASIGAANLASLASGERVVFGLRPTRMQAALSPGSLRVLESFLQDSAQYKQAMKGLGNGDGDELDVSSMLSMGREADGKGPLADAHLELWPAGGMIAANLTVYDLQGRSLGQGFSIVDLTPPTPLPVNSGEPLVVTELGREWGAKLLEASQASSALRNGPMGMSMMFSGAGSAAAQAAKPNSAALKALISDPVQNSLAAPLFEPVARTISGDLIATVPDSAFHLLASLVSEPRTTSAAARAALENAHDLSVTSDGTLTLIGASTPGRLHREFANRPALRDLVAAIGRTGYLRLDDAARFAIAQGLHAGALNLGSPLVSLIQGKPPFFFMGDPLISDFEALRIYGSLSTAQRTALASGRGVAFQTLSADAADALRRLLFDSTTGPFPSAEEAEVGAEVDDEEMEGLFASLNNRSAERTVRFADGVPRQGYLTMKITSQDQYRMIDSATGATTFGDGGVLGLLRGAKDVPYLRSYAGTANYDRFTPAKNRSLDLRFVFGPRLAMSRSLEDYEVTSTQVLTFDQMPKEFRDEVEEMSKMAGEMRMPTGKIKP